MYVNEDSKNFTSIMCVEDVVDCRGDVEVPMYICTEFGSVAVSPVRNAHGGRQDDCSTILSRICSVSCPARDVLPEAVKGKAKIAEAGIASCYV